MGDVWVLKFRIGVAGWAKGEACEVEDDEIRNSVYSVVEVRAGLTKMA